ncbi:MAG TPA: tetratricopeptide repeat protein, partial [Longimicrobiales bacterium]
IAERTLYLPSLAACLLAGYAWDAAMESSQQESRKAAYALAIVIIAFFSVRTVIRNRDWDSLTTVWKSLHRDHPESYRAQWLNAVGMWEQGRPDLAERYFEFAYRLWDRDSQMITEWGNFYIGQRRYDRAIELLEKSRAMTPFVPRTHEYLAYAYLHAGRPRDALTTANHALTLEAPHPPILYPVIARAHERLGNREDAVQAWRSTVRFKQGDLWLNWAMLARAQAATGKKEDALRSADVALTKTNNDPRSSGAVRQLKEAINEGCYPPGGACDPLLSWEVAVGTTAAQAPARR